MLESFVRLHISLICVDKSFNVEVKLQGSARSKQKEETMSDDDDIKDINFVLLEERDFLSNRVSLSANIEPVIVNKSNSTSSSDKSSATTVNKKAAVVLQKMSLFREPLLLEHLCTLGLVVFS